MKRRVFVRVDPQLLEQLSEAYPETKDLPYAARTNLFLKKLLEANRRDRGD
jgi:hypothetical protein